MDPNGKRQTIRLGKIELRHAESVRVKIEALLSAKIIRHPLDRETSEWVTKIGDDLHAKLARTGLVKQREASTLGEWLDVFITNRDGLKPSSIRKLEQTGTKLIEYFSDGKAIHEITPSEASQWRDSLTAEGLSIASVKTHTGNAKTIFREIEQRGIIEESPFSHLKGGATPTKNNRYVTPEEIEKVLDAAPDAEWRALFGLARLAGLRTPSETGLLTWSGIDWGRGRLCVFSPKTERHAGHESRTVPISPWLMEILRERFDQCEIEQEHVVTIKRCGATQRKMRQIVDRAGVEQWDAFWQTLRRSCEIEWAQKYPQYAVSKWIGHSITVSGRHYTNSIPDELFDTVSGISAAQNTAQHTAESARTEQKIQSRKNAIQGRKTVP